MKTVTVNGKKYRLEWVGYCSRVDVRGPGIVAGFYLPPGVTLDSPGLRSAVIAELAEYKARHAAASALVQERVRNGTAGLGN